MSIDNSSYYNYAKKTFDEVLFSKELWFDYGSIGLPQAEFYLVKDNGKLGKFLICFACYRDECGCSNANEPLYPQENAQKDIKKAFSKRDWHTDGLSLYNYLKKQSKFGKGPY